MTLVLETLVAHLPPYFLCYSLFKKVITSLVWKKGCQVWSRGLPSPKSSAFLFVPRFFDMPRRKERATDCWIPEDGLYLASGERIISEGKQSSLNSLACIWAMHSHPQVALQFLIRWIREGCLCFAVLQESSLYVLEHGAGGSAMMVRIDDQR